MRIPVAAGFKLFAKPLSINHFAASTQLLKTLDVSTQITFLECHDVSEIFAECSDVLTWFFKATDIFSLV